MAPKNIVDTIEKMRAKAEVSFAELVAVCGHYFGAPRVVGSHHIYKTPWQGDPRINIQNAKGKAKRYQVRQVLQALDKLAEMAMADKKKPPKK